MDVRGGSLGGDKSAARHPVFVAPPRGTPQHEDRTSVFLQAQQHLYQQQPLPPVQHAQMASAHAYANMMSTGAFSGIGRQSSSAPGTMLDMRPHDGSLPMDIRQAPSSLGGWDVNQVASASQLNGLNTQHRSISPSSLPAVGGGRPLSDETLNSSVQGRNLAPQYNLAAQQTQSQLRPQSQSQSQSQFFASSMNPPMSMRSPGVMYAGEVASQNKHELLMTQQERMERDLQSMYRIQELSQGGKLLNNNSVTMPELEQARDAANALHAQAYEALTAAQQALDKAVASQACAGMSDELSRNLSIAIAAAQYSLQSLRRVMDAALKTSSDVERTIEARLSSNHYDNVAAWKAIAFGNQRQATGIDNVQALSRGSLPKREDQAILSCLRPSESTGISLEQGAPLAEQGLTYNPFAQPAWRPNPAVGFSPLPAQSMASYGQTAVPSVSLLYNQSQFPSQTQLQSQEWAISSFATAGQVPYGTQQQAMPFLFGGSAGRPIGSYQGSHPSGGVGISKTLMKPKHEAGSRGNTEKGKTVSRSCHACGHMPSKRASVVCRNFENGTCRKLLCEKCLVRHLGEQEAKKHTVLAKMFATPS
ncbi:hypothetical protein FVE85_8027 [Porphyridium purpureum]|uniref:Uncharacterized protein n=1 Tax=Porphyridium purpureum TaxID=35688 RepID=A0A5J4YNK9_PORPP|nr:hypothetical protein FVE85_8027 [Porphyridium purpureum]|eukprot:POR4095..scf295_9